jgi:hypothetical protein
MLGSEVATPTAPAPNRRRRLGGHHSGTDHSAGTTDHQHRSSGPFVRGPIPDRPGRVGLVDEVIGRIASFETDVDDPDLPAVLRSVTEKVGGLERVERHCHVGPDRSVTCFTGIGFEPGGQVEGQDGRAFATPCGNLGRDARPRPDAEHSVDDEIGFRMGDATDAGRGGGMEAGGGCTRLAERDEGHGCPALGIEPRPRRMRLHRCCPARRELRPSIRIRLRTR